MMANLTSEYFISGLGTLCVRVCVRTRRRVDVSSWKFIITK